MHLGGIGFGNFLLDLFVIFMFVLWIWLLISVFSDLFRRHDISGGAKVVWVIFLIILPYLGVLAYVLTQGGGMAERQQAQAEKAKEDLRNMVGFSVADEIKKLDDLKASGSISDAEYAKLRAKLV
ncbi:MAG: PLDc N-terminal domain-containing protein [Bauldia sp.]|nr:PLDc N-terminal domain-containing protein [Bauldia sp.]